jgi:branched-chain amino acid transport system substrate-binding protein
MYLFQVKKPEESKSDWDMYKQLAKIPGDSAYMKVADSGCQVTQ